MQPPIRFASKRKSKTVKTFVKMASALEFFNLSYLLFSIFFMDEHSRVRDNVFCFIYFFI